MDRDDARMIERSDRTRLALETGTAVRIARSLAGEYLQRDLASEPDVFGEVHLAHPPCAQRPDDAVVGDAVAGRECTH